MREKTKSFVHASVCLCDKLMETIFIWVMFPAQSGLKGGGGVCNTRDNVTKGAVRVDTPPGLFVWLVAAWDQKRGSGGGDARGWRGGASRWVFSWSFHFSQ